MSETPCPFCGQIHGTACNAMSGYTELEVVAAQNEGRCPTCVSSESGYCSMWQMGMSEPCPLYKRRKEATDE